MTKDEELVAWADMDVRGEDKGLSWTPGHFHKTPLYATPPQRKPLTREQCLHLEVTPFMTIEQVVRVVEAAHHIKENT